jgi:glycosyltransferase involved in cell wall biosynthesis
MLDLQIVNKVVHYKKMIILMNNPLLQPDLFHLFNIDVNKIIIAYVSKTSQNAILLQQPTLNKFNSILLYNSINLDDIQTPILKKDDSFVFFACSDRGYGIAANVAEAFPHFKLYSNTYANELKYLLKEQTANNSKNAVFKHLACSKYFIYPLINLEKGCIHYDTFAYVILEALLHGVIVITVRNPVFEELFGDAVCYIDTDDILSMDCFTTWSQKIEIKLEISEFLKEYTRRFIEKVKILEDADNLRSKYIRKGVALRNKFSSATVFDTLFKDLNPPKCR